MSNLHYANECCERWNVVTICGSTRFRHEMAEANRLLTLNGFLVLAPGVFAHDGDQMTSAQKERLDKLHFKKIDLSNAIYVVNPGGYIGESTAREIEYAKERGKRVDYLTDETFNGVRHGNELDPEHPPYATLNHHLFVYGQSSADGWACRKHDCSWQDSTGGPIQNAGWARAAHDKWVLAR